MSDTSTMRRRLTAWHEAAHATVACALGVLVIDVATSRDGTGITHTRGDPSAADAATIAVAGAIGEDMATGTTLDGHGGAWDYLTAVAVLGAAGVVDVEAAVEAAETRARAILEQHRGALAEVATALETQGGLGGEELAAMWARHQRRAKRAA